MLKINHTQFEQNSRRVEYLPFGETLVEEHLNSNNSPFRFNAKELDCLSREAVRFGKETGNYYYGARYYDPKWSIWISVDPLAELMPEWSSYAYTFNNPVNFTDPTGMVPEGGGCDDPPCDDDYFDPNEVQELDEVVVTADKYGVNLANSGYSKDDLRIRSQILSSDDPMRTSLLAREREGNFQPLYDPSRPYAGFAEEYAAGHQGWGDDDLASFWMNATSASVVGSLLIVGSPALISQSSQALASLGLNSQIGSFSMKYALRNMGIETATEFLSSGLSFEDMNLIAIGASSFGGKWGAQAIGSSFSYSVKDQFYVYSMDRALLNFSVNKFNTGLNSFTRNLTNKNPFNGGFGRAFLPSLSIGVQSGLKASTNGN